MMNVTTAFPNLLSPIKIGRQQVRNRVVMGSMHTRLEHTDNPLARQIAFYVERARGGVGLIVTGGFSPNEAGRIEDGAPILNTVDAAMRHHKPVVDAVHAEGSKILMQLLHTGRYAKHDNIVGVSELRSPINPRVPRALSAAEVWQTIEDFVKCAELAVRAGYDGVEVMGSEGYFVNQFVVPRTNNRNDEWGGSLEKRIRFPVELVKAIRQRLGPEFIIMYRISALDLVDGGSTAEEIDVLARGVEAAGADVINTGYGWHEAPIPTIAYHVPRAMFRFASARLKKAVSIPVVASNRINTPEMAEDVLSAGDADMVSMARPLLADPQFVVKAQQGRAADINVCVACNQACLDFIFSDKTATCLVNPRACRETEFPAGKAATRSRIAVVGSGPAGLSCAINAAERGHDVVLFEADAEIGGQLNLARSVPGKQEFNELLRYFRARIASTGVSLRTSTRVTKEVLAAGKFDRVVLASGIRPRVLDIPGSNEASVVSYVDVLTGRVKVGRRVAIIGMGGIGYDVAELLSSPHAGAETAAEFMQFWGIDATITKRGGLTEMPDFTPIREITMLQRTPGRAGARLGKSTGWILRSKLQKRHVKAIVGATYNKIDKRGLHFSVDGVASLLEVDTIVVCAGQEPDRRLEADVHGLGLPVDVIGGALFASELDALRAIDEGMRLAYRI